jgi:NADPH-ferrihemoprotein reductase
MASGFAEEAAEHGFNGISMSLKDITHEQFKVHMYQIQPNQISVFFMANTGEGEPPENAVNFMKMLAGKSDLEGQTPQWQNMNYVVFGLGDTQYEHFNKIGIDTDIYL